MRVAHVINDLDVGGAEAMLIKLIGASDRSCVEHSVVTLMDGGPLAADVRSSGIHVATLGMHRNFPNPAIVWRLICTLKHLQPDVIQSWLYQSDFVAALAAPFIGVPLIWNLRSSNLDMSYSHPISRLLPRALARLSRVPDVVMVNSHAALPFHQALGYHPRRWEVIPNGFDTVRFRPDLTAGKAVRREFDIREDTPVITMPARFHAMKDHGTFFAAAAMMHPDVVFILVGPGIGPKNADLHVMVDSSGLGHQVRIVGSRNDMPSIYAASDLVTLSSAFGEGFPNVIGEAMACGIPCVATDVGDSAMIIGDCGRVVPPQAPTALASSWREILSFAPDVRAALGVAARKRICERYSLSAIVKAYEGLYTEAIAHRSRNDLDPGS